MKINNHIRPALLCATALFASACSYGGQNTPSVLASAPQANTNGQSSGQGELVRIANQMAANGDHAAAIPIYRHLAGKNGNVAAMNALASSLIAIGQHSEASEVLSVLVERGQATADTWYSLGKTMLAQGKFEEALSAFNGANNAGDRSSKVQSGRAVSLAALGRTGEAVSAFGANSDRLSLSNKALVFAATGRANAAVNILEPLIQNGEGTSRDRQNLAMAYLLSGRDQDAYGVARLDLDAATINETFTFYRSLTSLQPSQRMQALVTGAVDPEWTRSELANLEIQETTSRAEAAKRVVEDAILARTEPKVMIAEAPKPEPKPEPVVEQKPRADYVLTEVPPLVEPEGWALQIGAYRTLKNLMRGWTILYRQSGDLLEDIPPRRSEVDFGDNEDEPSGFYYRLNAGPLKSLARARELCKALKERGTSCWIRPPEVKEGALPKATSAETDTPDPAATTASVASPQSSS
jgi:Flp pilus assembly protein TadD